MPHITKFQEKRQCVKTLYNDWSINRERINNYNARKNLFDIIEQIIDETLPKLKDLEFFNEFVDIKEVPYGRYNSDSDYRGS